MVEPLPDVEALIEHLRIGARELQAVGLEEPGASYNVALPAFINDAATALRTLQERVKDLEMEVTDLRIVRDGLTAELELATSRTALLPSLPDGWAGPTYEDACRLSRAFNQSANLRDDQDRRINEWIKTLIQQSQIAARSTPPTEPPRGWDDAAVERAARAHYIASGIDAYRDAFWDNVLGANKEPWIAPMRAALAALSPKPLETER